VARRTAAVAAITDPERRGRAAWALLHEFAGRDQLMFVRDVRALRRMAREVANPGPPVVRERAPKIEGVTFRCRRCARSLGRHAPALLILQPVGPVGQPAGELPGHRPTRADRAHLAAAVEHRWLIHQVATWGRSDSSGARFEYLPGQHARSRSRILAGQTPLEYEGSGTKLHIACRGAGCRHKPRPSAHTLCAEADRAVAAGRDYEFV